MDIEAEKKEMLSGLIAYLGNFEGGVRSTIELYQEGSIEQAKQNTIEVIDGLGWIVEGVDLLKKQLNIDVRQLTGALEQLQISLENDDDVMTSDIFENDLLPTLAAWKQRMMDVVDQPPS